MEAGTVLKRILRFYPGSVGNRIMINYERKRGGPITFIYNSWTTQSKQVNWQVITE